MMSFIKSGSETRIYRISSGNKLDGIYDGRLSQHNSLTFFDDDTKFFTQFSNVRVNSLQRYLNDYPKFHTKYSKPSKRKVPAKSKARSLITSL